MSRPPEIPKVGEFWRFAALVDECPEEVAANRFRVEAVDLEAGYVSLRADKDKALAETRSLNDFLTLFERLPA